MSHWREERERTEAAYKAWQDRDLAEVKTAWQRVVAQWAAVKKALKEFFRDPNWPPS